MLLNKSYLAELFGTFMLVLVGCGAAVLKADFQLISHFWVSFAFGAVVFLMIMALAKYSGAHINPAVSIAFYLQGKITKKDLPFYVLYQCIGAILAAMVLQVFAAPESQLGSSLSSLNNFQVFAIEFILSMALMLVIFIAVKFSSKLWQIAFVVGGIVFIDAYFGGPFTGASMNPARSIGPALVSGELRQLWIYILSPSLACMLSLPLFNLIFSNEKNLSSLHR